MITPKILRDNLSSLSHQITSLQHRFAMLEKNETKSPEDWIDIIFIYLDIITPLIDDFRISQLGNYNILDSNLTKNLNGCVSFKQLLKEQKLSIVTNDDEFGLLTYGIFNFTEPYSGELISNLPRNAYWGYTKSKNFLDIKITPISQKENLSSDPDITFVMEIKEVSLRKLVQTPEIGESIFNFFNERIDYWYSETSRKNSLITIANIFKNHVNHELKIGNSDSQGIEYIKKLLQ